MKIVFFSSYFIPYLSGLTLYSFRILKHLAKKNKIEVLTFTHMKGLAEVENLHSIKITRMPYLFKISKGYISPLSLLYFLKKMKTSDVVMINLPNAEGLALGLIAKIFRKKIISIFLCEVKLGPGFFNWFINLILNFSVYCQLLLSDIIIAIPDYVEHIPMIKLFRNKIKTVLPPIEMLEANKFFQEQLLAKKKSCLWIGYVGRISSEKGIEYLIEAVSNVQKKNKNIALIFAGPKSSDIAGEEKYFLRIKNLLLQKKINHYFFDNLQKDQLGAFYKTIDLLVLPSVNKTEAFGMVQVEAMFQGTPVIATNMPGVRLPIQKTGMGILVKPKNSQEIKSAILNIVENRNQYTSADLVSCAKKEFNIDRVFKFYENLLLLP